MLFPQIPVLLDRLANPEYLYLILEPMALYGLFFGLLFLLGSITLKQHKARTLALIIIAASSLSVIPYRAEKADAMQRILAIRDKGHTTLLTRHSQMRDQTLWVNYSLASLALLTAITRGKLSSILTPLIFITAIASLIFYLWLNLKESEIYHPNLRRTTTIPNPHHPSTPPT